MIERILHDSQLHPGAFFWRGRLSITAIEDWERKESLRAPGDLKQLWSLKGGGDLFESETVLQPFGAEEYDLIGPVSAVCWGRGLSTEYCVFHTGLADSVFRKSDGSIFVLASAGLNQMSQFQDLDDWYAKTLRSEFADRYGLAAAV